MVPPFSGQRRDWDIDHVPELGDNPTRPEALDNYNSGTRLECPACNRSRGDRDSQR